jgi:hypothetical protein
MYFLLHRCLYCKLPTTTLNSLSKKLVNLQRDFKEESEARKQGPRGSRATYMRSLSRSGRYSMEGSNSSCRHEIIQMNTEMLNNISEKPR